MALTPAPASIPALVQQRIAERGEATILRKKDRGIWKSVSWAELGAQIRQAGAGLQAIGFRPGDVAAVLAETRPEWVVADLAILSSGGVSLGVPADASPDTVGDMLRDAGCRVLFVENEEQLDKALAARNRCPALRHIIILDMTGLREFDDAACESYAALLARGAEGAAQDRQSWDAGIAAVTAQHPALLVPHGGGMQTLTHAELLRRVSQASQRLGLREGDERLALLPMADTAERVYGLYCALSSGVVSNYLENPDTVLENLQELQPTILGADAVIWGHLHDRISRGAAAATLVQRMLYRWAIGAGRRGGADHWLARVMVLHAVRRELGLGRLRRAYVGDSQPAPDVRAWAESLGIDIIQIEADAPRTSASTERHGAAIVEA